METPKRPVITPHQLDLFTEPVVDIYRALENEIFLMVAKRLKTSPDYGSDHVLRWQVEKMQQLRILNQETIRALSRATGLAEKKIIEAIEQVGVKTIKSVDKELEYAFEPLPIPNYIDQVMAAFVQQTFREIDNFVNQTLITTNYGEGAVTRMYRKIVEETTGRVLAGNITVNKAIAETVIRWADKGIETAFIDRGGHVWSLERYADTVIRSTVNRTYNRLRTERMAEYGVHTVLVSSLPDPREACSKIQGKVASLKRPSENDTGYPSVYEFGYGTPGGIRGVNCRHMFYPYIPGLTKNNQPQYDEATMKRNRELSQKQRYLERQVRRAKRSLMLAEEIGDEDTIQRYKRLVRARQAAVREFVEEHGLARRYDKERVIVRGGNYA